MSAIALETRSFTQRLFFVLMASAVIVVVFVGFAPTFYLRSSFPQTRSMSLLLHVHGIVFSAWVSFFLVQTVLIARGARRLHQRRGWIGVGLSVAMVLLVFAAMVEELRRVHGFPPPPLALSLSLFDIVVFASLVGAAVRYRRRPDWHKRLTLSATILLLGAPMFRLTLNFLGVSDPAEAGMVSALLVDAFFVPCFAYDLLAARRLHPVYPIALVLIVLDQTAQAKVVDWQPWIDFSSTMQRLVS
jgi:hypothetical protein